MEDFRIRSALVSDAKGIAEVHVYTWQSAYLGLIPDSFLRDLSVGQKTTNWIRNLETPLSKTHTFVAEINGEIVGFIGVGAGRETDISSQGEVFAIYVHPDIQGRGIGTALMQSGLQDLIVQGFASATLWVLGRNLNTRNWYISHGWKTSGRSKIEQRGDVALKEIEYQIELALDN